MRAVLQRVLSGNVSVGGSSCGSIEKGIVMLLGILDADTEPDMRYILDKTVFLRIFEDENDKMNLSLADVKGSLLIVPNFTLYGDARKGRRPSYSQGASPESAKKIYDTFLELAKTYPVPVEAGIFQAEMRVNIENDGPVTILLDSEKQF